MRSHERILRAVYGTPWAIQPEKLDAIAAFFELLSCGHRASEDLVAQLHSESIQAAARASQASSMGGGSIAVLPLFGVISQRANMMSDISGPRGTSIDKYTAQFRQALADPNVKAIVLDVDSPGGTINGVAEFADEVYRARGKKPIVAVADSLMASAAYWVGCAATECVASPTAMVGSVGVYTLHTDASKAIEDSGYKMSFISAGKYKTEGNSYEPLSDSGRQAMQDMVDQCYGMFTRSVAKSRGVKAEDVRNGFGEGRCLMAQAALKEGMIDAIETLDQVISRLAGGRSVKRTPMDNNDPAAAAAADSVEADLAGASDPDSISRDIEIRRRQLELAGL